ncbi:hypothetical protein [Niabella aurantiaca]|uniref:hypothetical protein n=1 Tax=Niabella aurantiaca TaxID=379900 RepID=UPI0012FCD89B|nr:hypothetical protein [Niabella aurantiaca]
MKATQLLPILGLTLLMAACEKSADNQPTTLEGKWEMRTTWGDMPLTTYPEGNGNQLQFNNNHYVRLENNEVKKTGTFSLVKDKSAEATVGLVIPEGQFESRIIFESDPGQKVFYQFSNDTLYLLQGFFPTDGGSKTGYVRIQ